MDRIKSNFVEDHVWWDALTKNVNIDKDDDGTVVAYPALRQTCNPPGFGFCSLFDRSGIWNVMNLDRLEDSFDFRIISDIVRTISGFLECSDYPSKLIFCNID